MAQVSYHPEPGVSDDTEQFGYHFSNGKPTDVTDAKALAKFAGNPFFLVEGEAEPDDPNKLEAVHKGGGRFIIIRGGDKSSPVKDGLDKADAAAFNALSDEDKASYVAD